MLFSDVRESEAVVSLAKKLREVVAANFIEIARSDTPTPAPTEAQKAAQRELDTAYTTGAEGHRSVLAEQIEQARAETEAALASAAEAQAAEPVEDPRLVNLADAVSDEGAVDFDRIFRHNKVAPSVFTAEQALTMLTTMPKDLPLRVKRVTIKATLDAIGGAIGANPDAIVNDAEAKLISLENYLTDFSSVVEKQREETDGEITRLQEEIENKKRALVLVEEKRHSAQSAVEDKLDTYRQVMSFFRSDDIPTPEETADQGDEEIDPDDLPPFMREDAVLRMLGISSPGEGDTTDENGQPRKPGPK